MSSYEKLKELSTKIKKDEKLNIRISSETKKRLLNIISYYENNITMTSLLDFIIDDFLSIMEKEIENKNKIEDKK
jgi:hypothetical protein